MIKSIDIEPTYNIWDNTFISFTSSHAACMVQGKIAGWQ